MAGTTTFSALVFEESARGVALSSRFSRRFTLLFLTFSVNFRPLEVLMLLLLGFKESFEGVYSEAKFFFLSVFDRCAKLANEILFLGVFSSAGVISLMNCSVRPSARLGPAS